MEKHEDRIEHTNQTTNRPANSNKRINGRTDKRTHWVMNVEILSFAYGESLQSEILLMTVLYSTLASLGPFVES